MAGSMESLPSDVVQDIVSRVPAESVLECKFVCKKWQTLIRESNFANMHLKHQLSQLHGGDDEDGNLVVKGEPCLFFACRTDNPDEFTSLLFHGGQLSDRISTDEKYIYSQNLKRVYHPPMHNEPLFDHLVGSCNGLVCTFQDHNLVIDPIYICNPLTREYVHLPPLVVKKEDVEPSRIKGEKVSMYYFTACGFGYCRSTDEYKVVRIHYFNYDEGNVEVYTLGSGCGWRAIGKVPYVVRVTSGGMGTYANDAIYWLSSNTLVVFDLATEKFRLLSVPPCMERIHHGHRSGLVVLARHLCLYVDKMRVEIWSLRKGRDSKETWRIEFDIDYEAVVGSRKKKFQPILLTKNGDIIFLHGKSVMYCYDTKTKFLKMISNEASTDYFEAVEAIAHVDTFVSMKSMGETSKRYAVHTPWNDVTDELNRDSLSEEIDTTPYKFRWSAR